MDSFFGIGIFELIMIAVVALVVLGPERLPGAMREGAKYMKQLRNISNEFQSQFSEELKILEEIDPRRILNEAIDPNSSAATTAAKPPATGATNSSPAKPPATAAAAAPAAAVKPPAPAPKPPAPASTPSVPPAITNGEPANTILPPVQGEVATEQPVTPPPAPATGASEPDSPAPAAPLADAGLNGHQPSASAASNTGTQQ